MFTKYTKYLIPNFQSVYILTKGSAKPINVYLYGFENYFSIDREKTLPQELKGKLGLIDRNQFKIKAKL